MTKVYVCYDYFGEGVEKVVGSESKANMWKHDKIKERIDRGWDEREVIMGTFFSEFELEE